jgi:serine/threonine protein kinase
MGEVWEARDTRLDRTVAIKFSLETFSERFEREARAVGALNHPNICQIHDVGPDYLVLEYVEGAPLAAPETPRKLLDLAVQIADGIAAAHAAGFVHRDLKPDKILVTRDNRVKILDFGLAKQPSVPKTAGETQTMGGTDPSTILGTFYYMSPEQARGQQVDARADQFYRHLEMNSPSAKDLAVYCSASSAFCSNNPAPNTRAVVISPKPCRFPRRLAIVALLAQRLMIAEIPKPINVAPMRLDVIDYSRRRVPACPPAMNA